MMKETLTDTVGMKRKLGGYSKSVHGGKLFAASAGIEEAAPRLTKSVHCGMHFAMEFARPEVGKRDSLAVLTQDELNIILRMLMDSDLSSLVSLKGVCRELNSLTKDLLDHWPINERVTALVEGRVPASEISTIEKQAAKAFVHGLLEGHCALALVDYANTCLQNGHQFWWLSTEPEGADDGNDLSFQLKGFDATPLVGATSRSLRPGTVGGSGQVAEWYATHMPPVHCAAGPPRYVFLAGAAGVTSRTLRHVPLELCRVIRRPGGCDQVAGCAFISALFDEEDVCMLDHGVADSIDASPQPRAGVVLSEYISEARERVGAHVLLGVYASRWGGAAIGRSEALANGPFAQESYSVFYR
eukprot:CAMPEP_0115890208 /NCGR_PEP_ID=MMETSP0287-20121206/33229_1 /TAXON_ID=412157 /ORGANISM="Chrysochromulina rotalis, Strain UIO044" /LENGTH=357 /DNA_ID=CAMNT_0003346965 /DNA_START=1 /DNA_END=1073 /DNA_ORIENTATION=-